METKEVDILTKNVVHKFTDTLMKFQKDENISWNLMSKLLAGFLCEMLKNNILENNFKNKDENNYEFQFYKICLEFTEKVEDLALKMERDAEKDE